MSAGFCCLLSSAGCRRKVWYDPHPGLPQDLTPARTESRYRLKGLSVKLAASGGVSYKWRVLGTVVFGFFMILLDTTVINVAFQALRLEFGGSIAESQWIISVYVLAMGIVMPMSGFLANRFGSKRVYLGALGLFALGSLLCGMSTSLYMLIAFRVVQGIGGGIAMPLGTSLLLQAFPVEEHGTALGIFGIAALVAPALGPILGGWLVGMGLWRVIFLINPPIGLAAVLLGSRFLRDSRDAERPPLDLPGMITEIIGFGAVLYAASIAAEQGWSATTTRTWFAIGVLGLAAFAVVELFVARAPLLDLRLFANRLFLNATLLGYVSVLALFGAEFLMPIYLQALRGLSPLQTGVILLSLALTSGVLVMLSGQIYDRIGPRPLIVSGFAILLLNTWQFSQITATTSIAWITVLLALRGVALGLTAQTTMAAALSVVPRRDLPRGASLTNSTRLVVQSIAVAVLATVLTSALSPETVASQQQAAGGQRASLTGLCESAAQKSAPGLAAVQPVAGQARRACDEYILGFERSYRLTFYASFVALVLGLVLPGWPQKWAGRGAAAAPGHV